MSTSSTYSPAAQGRTSARWITSGIAIVWAIALAKLLLHIYFNNRYGYFRDEFDYMACGSHLAWGYVDQPPLVPFLVHICRAMFGDSLRSIRLVPTLASSLLVVQTALIVRELGGRRFAMALSAIAVALAPQYLSNGSLLTTNCLEPNLWMGCAYCAILAVKRADPRYWLWFGVIAGIGLEEKYTIALFGFAIVVGLLLTKERHAFADKWIWLGGAAAFLIFLPNLLWNIHYHWPFLQLMHNIRAEHRDVVLPAGQYFLQQMWFATRFCSDCTGKTITWRPSIPCCWPPARLPSNHLPTFLRKLGSSPPLWLSCRRQAYISCPSRFRCCRLMDSSRT
jgi:hypothetical protein